MDEFTCKNRLLLMFAPTADEPILAAQRGQLSDDPQGLIDRDMVLIEIVADQVMVMGRTMPDLEAGELRDRYGVGESQAAVLLVGKDGGVKVRQAQAVSAESLFATIDAMPMRRRKMRARQ